MKYMLVRHKVTDSEAAHAFVNSPQADEGAEAAGVLDEPDCWYLD